jgi:hypothetical protein
MRRHDAAPSVVSVPPPIPEETAMKAILSVAVVVAALALAAPAGARPLYDPPLHPLTTHPAAPPPAAHPSDDNVEVAVIVGAVAFLLGAGAAQVVRVPRRRTA